MSVDDALAESGQFPPGLDFDEEEEMPAEPLPDWVTPPRWYRSNAGGMMLEEIPSRLAAIRNEYALVSDFIGQDELPEFLLPYYDNHYIEIRVLYHNAEESRRQWIFRDKNGLYRLVAVFREAEAAEKESPEQNDEIADNTETPDEDVSADGAEGGRSAARQTADAPDSAEKIPAPDENAAGGEIADDAAAQDADNDSGELADVLSDYKTFVYKNVSGFIEIYGDDFLLAREIVFSGEDYATETIYTYNKGTLIKTEVVRNKQANAREEVQKLWTDIFRYNRSGSLRSVERTYHERLDEEKVRLTFAHRVLDAAANSMFLNDQLYLSSDFYDDWTILPDQKMVFTTDDRHRILTQTLLDSAGEAIWVIKNTWSGDRIASALKIQGEEQKLNEYEYDSKGNRIAERNLLNGVLQRQVIFENGRDIEELYMNGLVVLRAIWEDGRKVSEQRVKSGDNKRNVPEQPVEKAPPPEEPEQSGEKD